MFTGYWFYCTIRLLAKERRRRVKGKGFRQQPLSLWSIPSRKCGILVRGTGRGIEQVRRSRSYLHGCHGCHGKGSAALRSLRSLRILVQNGIQLSVDFTVSLGGTQGHGDTGGQRGHGDTGTRLCDRVVRVGRYMDRGVRLVDRRKRSEVLVDESVERR